jgi:hypothetical protein
MKLECKPVRVDELKAGDLFVNSTQEEMDTLVENEMGVSVFLRTSKPLDDKIPVEKFHMVQKIKIKK